MHRKRRVKMLISPQLAPLAALPHNLTEDYLPVPLDHSAPWTGRKLMLRYLMDDETHFTSGGPLIVYTGNEGDVEDFAANCGFLWVLAEKWRGAVAFIEERYYGKSVPRQQQRGDEPFAFLSSQQVVEDFAVALWTLRRQLNTTRVVAVGGSYGGMLAAWLRKRHPDLVTAALASSAPVLGFASTLMQEHRAGGFWEVTERAFAPCREALGVAFRALWSAPAAAWGRVSADFGLCPQSRIRNATHLEALIGYLQQQLSDLAFANYPYGVGSLPAHPVAYACSRVHTSDDSERDGWLPLRDALAWRPLSPRGAGSSCLALRGAFAAYTPGFLPGPWTFQRCTDVVMAFGVRNTSRMFLPCDGANGFRANCAAEGQAALRDFCAREFAAVVPDSAELQAIWGRNWTAWGGGAESCSAMALSTRGAMAGCTLPTRRGPLRQEMPMMGLCSSKSPRAHTTSTCGRPTLPTRRRS